MDPPRRASQAPAPPGAGFPSPLQDYARLNNKFVDDCTRLTFAVQQSVPEAVRRIVRDNWQKCLLGSEFHQAFILNASIHHATPSITQRAVRDFGRKMVAESAEELIKHFTTVDLDSIADVLLEKASDSFLDKCLAKRLLTIEAKPLVNALARAERLGYAPTDNIILEDRHERVVVQEAFPGAKVSIPTTAPPRPNPPPQVPTTQLQCNRCFRTFPYQAAFDYHTQKNVCSIAPPTSRGFAHSCAPCGQGFDRIEELGLHTESKVCSTKARPVTQTPVTNGFVPSQPRPTPTQPTPTQTQSLPRRAASIAASGTPSGSPIPSDPYAHLTPDKLEAMNEELQEAEAKYAPRFQEAELIADEKERRQKVEGLRNSFGTKQSMIRKKYGVRLRERRTKAEIQAERERLGIKRQEREMERSFISGSPAELASAAPKPKQPAAPRSSVGSGWTAANTPRADSIWQEHEAKRRRLDNTGEYRASPNGVDQTTPSRKLISATELGGGLAGSSATAELHDPTMPPQPAKAYEQSGARVQIHEPATNGHAKQATAAISVDDSSDDSSDDEDIPSTLPSRSTPQKSHLGTATAS
ncbi:hypothetical protein QBC39DRAFT_270563 [Podospora conica]|nr:hypothetical protein QBC39DRAFT_270563 [Schizothecium conicum]